MRVIPALCVFVLLSLTQIARASSVLPLTTAEMIAHADAVFRGTVSGVSVLRHSSDDLIYTRTSLTVDEPLKGRFPSVVQLFHRGGQLGNEHDFHGLSPMLRPGGEYLLFVIRGPNGRLQSMQGAASAIPLYRLGTANGDAQFASPGQEILEETRALTRNGRLPGSDVRDQAGTSEPSTMAITGMLNNVNARFVQPDRGEPIPYLIDAASLPTGMTLAQATNAVQQALNAWAAVTSLKFQLEAIGSFGQGADRRAGHRWSRRHFQPGGSLGVGYRRQRKRLRVLEERVWIRRAETHEFIDAEPGDVRRSSLP
jgi:hypothetical protein